MQMKTYLVGGAVRDHLLGYPVTERDWVIVGSTPEALLQQGYRQVGRDFPVFLHPTTQEEYALARTERKQSAGYYGFVCDFSPLVSLEEDLARRDLTINAMAMDDHGNVIDPYHGLDDLQEKRLRHVSPAFVEDPVRVLRVARFAARYYHLGFRVAPETRRLMYQMVKAGELAHLVPERVWQEWHGALQERHPEVFIETLRACGALQVILPELDAMFGIPNLRAVCPEIDSGQHMLATLKEATALSESPSIRFAALMKDIGKAKTPMSRWPNHPGYERLGDSLIKVMCHRLRIPVSFSQLASMACRFHDEIHRVADLTDEGIANLLDKVDVYRRPERFLELLVVCEAEEHVLGGEQAPYPQAKWWREMLDECAKIDPQRVIAQGYQGAAIQAALKVLRIETITLLRKRYET